MQLRVNTGAVDVFSFEFAPSEVLALLVLAEDFRCFGEGYRDRRSNYPEASLSAKDTWKVPSDYPLPPVKQVSATITEWAKSRLSTYSKRNVLKIKRAQG
jgi:hypothetical protein